MSRSIKKQYPKIFVDWHPTLNGSLNPNLIKRNSTKKVWWKCHKQRCGFNWKDTIKGRTKLGRGCPQCEKRLKNRKVADKFEINATIDKMESLLKEINPHVKVFNNYDGVKRHRTLASIEIRKKLIEFEALNLQLRKAVLNQKKFEINKNKIKKQ